VKSETKGEGMRSACFRNCQAKLIGSPSSGIFCIYICPYECVCVCVSHYVGQMTT